MVPPLDIFRVGPEGQFIWKGAANDPATAQDLIKTLMAAEPGDYIIFNLHTGDKMLVEQNHSSEQAHPG